MALPRVRSEFLGLWLTIFGLLVTTTALMIPEGIARPVGDPVWDADNVSDATTPENRRSRNPSYANAPWDPSLGTTGGRLEDDGGALSGNYRLTLPLLSLPGRGRDFQLVMSYSSQLWAQAKGTMVFNPDADWPSPGWSIGFGKIVSNNSTWSGVFIGPDNSRKELYLKSLVIGQVVTMGVRGDSLASVEIPFEASERNAKWRDGRGQTVEYLRSTIGKVYYPSKIIDANGNYIDIAYVLDGDGQPAPPAIDHITDTVGRRVKFHYDAAKRLVAITAPGLNNEDEERVVAHFFYWKRDVNVYLGV